MVVRRTSMRRRATSRRVPRQRVITSVLAGSIVLAANEIDAFDLAGVVLADLVGARHLLTYGKVSCQPTVIPTVATTTYRWAYASRLDTTAVANLASAALLPVRDFTSAGAQVSDKQWRGRQYHHQLVLAGGVAFQTPLGNTDAKSPSQWTNYSVRGLGTADQGEGWYFYARNSTGVGITITMDLITHYALA